jgi:hypothetical protein
MIKPFNARLARGYGLACLGASYLVIVSCSPGVADQLSGGGDQAQAAQSSGSAGARAGGLRTWQSSLRATPEPEQRPKQRLAPIVRIVSPLADSAVAPGAASASNRSFEGSGFLFNVEVVTRDRTSIDLNEATLAPLVFGIRHVDELNAGAPNPDVRGFFVFFNQRS